MRRPTSSKWPRRRVAPAVVMALVLAAVIQFPGLPRASGATNSTSVPPTIDLSNPTATVNDPTSDLPYVETECHPGQTDINLASAAAISSQLGIASRPTVARIIAMRPWLEGADLSSVPGIGPQFAATIAPDVCATQPVLPPPTPMACTSSTQTDLQVATAPEISESLGLPLNTAQALIAARPLPQDLTQVLTPRVPGLSGPKLQRLINSGSVCVTPAPMMAGGSAWRWATSGGGTVVSRDGFSLIVPPGRVTDPTGAYASVTPMSPDSGGLPQMLADIWGNWTAGSTPVAIQGPWIGTESTSRPAVIHDESGEDSTLSIGDGAVISTAGSGQQTVTALAYALSGEQAPYVPPSLEVAAGAINSPSASASAPPSPFVFGLSQCQPDPSSSSPASFCLKSLVDGSLHSQWLHQTQQAAALISDSLTAQEQCGEFDTGWSTATANGPLQDGVNCSDQVIDSAGKVAWSFTNETFHSYLWGLLSTGVVYGYSVTDNGSSTSSVQNNPGEANEISTRLLSALTDNHYIFPGQSLVVSKSPSSDPTTVTGNVSLGATVAWSGMEELIGQVLDSLGPNASDVWSAVNGVEGCTPLSVSTSIECLRAALEAAISVTEHLDLAEGRTDEAAALDTLGKVFLAIDGASIAASFTDALTISGHYPTNVVLTNQPLSVAPPPTEATGCPGLSTCIVKIAGSTASYVLQSNGVSSPIPNGGTYICNAAYYPVLYNVDQVTYNSWVTSTGPSASCPVGTPAHLSSQTVPTGWLLREVDSDGNVTVWIMESNGDIAPLWPDESVFDCQAAMAPVWDYVSPSVINDSALFTIDPSVAATGCGLSTEP